MQVKEEEGKLGTIDKALYVCMWIFLFIALGFYFLYLINVHGGGQIELISPLLATIFAFLFILALKVGRLQAVFR